MKKVSLFILMLVPFAANAAGTYYTGAYQSPQTRYSTQTYAQRQTGYNRSYTTPSYASTRYNTYNTAGNAAAQNTAATTQQSGASAQASKNTGFWLDAGITHQMAQWQFEMAQSGSILSYDNIGWNVLDVSAGYAFGVGKTTMQIDAGLLYGMQWGESAMYDDDITNGGYLVTTWIDENGDFIGDQIGHAMSIGTSKGGNMLGFNVGFGLTDMFRIGNVRLTPSVGFRYLKYKLTTENNYGLAVDTAGCLHVEGSDEVQCDPAIVIIKNDGGTSYIIWRDDDDWIEGKIPDLTLPAGTSADDIVDTGGTYYYMQPGESHSYETTWMGPYLALDMDYDINQNNAVNARVELGLPGYKSVGDQPYRFDWQHPKSVEDEAGMFGAFHFGLGANWTTAITDSVALSIGLTYDYYTVSGADAKTYLNMNYYDDLYNKRLAVYEEAYPSGGNYGGHNYTAKEIMLGIAAAENPDLSGVPKGDGTAMNIEYLREACPGGVCKTDGEIESFYKSLGIRVGISARF